MDLNIVKEFLDFGHPREGSNKYHAAWKKLKAAYEEEIKNIGCGCPAFQHRNECPEWEMPY